MFKFERWPLVKDIFFHFLETTQNFKIWTTVPWGGGVGIESKKDPVVAPLTLHKVNVISTKLILNVSMSFLELWKVPNTCSQKKGANARYTGA